MKLEKYYRNKDKNRNMAKINLYQFICHDFSFMYVTPVIPDRDIISFDGSSQNAGFLYFLPMVLGS